jgi:hypothetical protein
MSQVTIYLEEETLALAKAAAARAKMSLSKWFAQFAEAEKAQKSGSLSEMFAEIDRLRADGCDDFPDLSELRATDSPELPREAW